MNPDIALTSLYQLILDPSLMGLVMLAVPLGMLFGIIPGLGGKLGIALCIPLVMGMDLVPGAVFLLAMHAVVHTSGCVPSILFGIPGTGPDAATVVDGYPLAQRGEAGRALGATLSASAIGGVVGAAILAAMIPVLEPVVLAFGPSEFFLLAVLGITFIAALSGKSLTKGLIVGCFGLMISFVGLNPQTGEPRFTGGQLFLWDGVDLIVAILAIFAVPEMIALGVKGGAISSADRSSANYSVGQVVAGMWETMQHKWLTLRTSVIGTVAGIIPGLGGDAAAWICYGHAVQSSKTPERFGKGAIEGVIAPEAANNSKEGGSLLPTLFFGVPGSSGMALLLGAFIMLGIEPGPQMLIGELPLVWTLIWALIIANIVAVLMLLLVAKQLSLLVFVRGGLIIPIVLVLAIVGSYLATGDWRHLGILMVLSALGYGFKRFDWPRPPFAVGLILGAMAEVSLNQSLAIWGPAAFLRPASLVLEALIFLNIAYYFWRQTRGKEGTDAF